MITNENIHLTYFPYSNKNFTEKYEKIFISCGRIERSVSTKELIVKIVNINLTTTNSTVLRLGPEQTVENRSGVYERFKWVWLTPNNPGTLLLKVTWDVTTVFLNMFLFGSITFQLLNWDIALLIPILLILSPVLLMNENLTIWREAFVAALHNEWLVIPVEKRNTLLHDLDLALFCNDRDEEGEILDPITADIIPKDLIRSPRFIKLGRKIWMIYPLLATLLSRVQNRFSGEIPHPFEYRVLNEEEQEELENQLVAIFHKSPEECHNLWIFDEAEIENWPTYRNAPNDEMKRMLREIFLKGELALRIVRFFSRKNNF